MNPEVFFFESEPTASVVRGRLNRVPLGVRGVWCMEEENSPPGVFIAEAIPPPGENKEYAVGDNHGNAVCIVNKHIILFSQYHI